MIADLPTDTIGTRLSALGYDAGFLKKLNAIKRLGLLTYHPLLDVLGFTTAQKQKVGKYFGGPQAVAEQYPELLQRLVELTPDTVVSLCNKKLNPRAFLPLLLELSADLMHGPLKLRSDQFMAILRSVGGKDALQALRDKQNVLAAAPLSLSADQATTLALCKKFSAAIPSLIDHFPALTSHPYNLTPSHVK